MRKAIFLALLSCWLASPCVAEDVTPGSVGDSTLDITGPDSVQPGADAYLEISGLTLDEIKAAKSGSLFDLTVFPLAGVRVHASYDWLNDQLELMFRAPNPGEYLVKLHLVRDGKLEIAAIVVVVEGDQPNPHPGPDPGPDPKPDPLPVPPVSDLFVTIVMEIDMIQGLNGLELNNQIEQVKDYLRSLPCQFQAMDDDPPEAKQWVAILDKQSVTTRPAFVVSSPTNGNLVIGANAFATDADSTIQRLKALGVTK